MWSQSSFFKGWNFFFLQKEKNAFDLPLLWVRRHVWAIPIWIPQHLFDVTWIVWQDYLHSHYHYQRWQVACDEKKELFCYDLEIDCFDYLVVLRARVGSILGAKQRMCDQKCIEMHLFHGCVPYLPFNINQNLKSMFKKWAHKLKKKNRESSHLISRK